MMQKSSIKLLQNAFDLLKTFPCALYAAPGIFQEKVRSNYLICHVMLELENPCIAGKPYKETVQGTLYASVVQNLIIGIYFPK